MKHIYVISGRNVPPFAAFNEIGKAITYLRKLAADRGLTFSPTNDAHDPDTGEMVYTMSTVLVIDEDTIEEDGQ